MSRPLERVQDEFVSDFTHFRVLGYDYVWLAVTKDALSAFFFFKYKDYAPPDALSSNEFENAGTLAMYIAAYWKELGIKPSEMRYSKYLSLSARQTYGNTESVKTLAKVTGVREKIVLDEGWVYDPDLHRIIRVIPDNVAEKNQLFSGNDSNEHIHVHYFVTPYDTINGNYVTFQKLITTKPEPAVRVRRAPEDRNVIYTCKKSAGECVNCITEPVWTFYGEATIVSPHLRSLVHMNTEQDRRFDDVTIAAFESDVTLVLSNLDSTLAVISPTRPRSRIYGLTAYSENYKSNTGDIPDSTFVSSPTDIRVRRALLCNAPEEAAFALFDIPYHVATFLMKRYGSAMKRLSENKDLQIPAEMIPFLDDVSSVNTLRLAWLYARVDKNGGTLDPPSPVKDKTVKRQKRTKKTVPLTVNNLTETETSPELDLDSMSIGEYLDQLPRN
jgi:hypothetical protein